MQKDQRIYFDNAMASRPSDRALAKMVSYMTEKWGNPSAPHQVGQELYPAIEENFRAIYRLMGAKDEDSFVLTSSGAEAINQAIFSTYWEVTRTTGKNQYVTSLIEEAPTLMSIERLEQMGCVGKMVKPNEEGRITVELIAEAITPRTAMISLAWANGLTGVVNPINEIAAICKDRAIILHLDATHLMGSLFHQFPDTGAHLISFNGEQLHAPRGSGGLWIKEGKTCHPLIVGGLEQAGRRAGALNVPALIGLGEAAKEVVETRDFICTEIARLRNKFEERLLQEYPEACIPFREQERLPNYTVIAFPGVANEALLYAINRKQLFASIGGGSFQQMALVLTACGLPEAIANTAISFCFSRYTTEEEVDRAVEIIAETAKRLRKISGKLL